MSNQALQRLGSASAGKKEDNIFAVFAYLNTRREFSPTLISTRVLVSPQTIVTYLRNIQKAQFFTERYKNRLKSAKVAELFGDLKGEELAFARHSLSNWKDSLRKVDDGWEERHQQLKQFIFEDNVSLSAETFYERLEKSILIYEFLKKNKTK